MKDIIAFMKEKYYILFFLTIGSIFMADFKLYIPLFALNIVYVGILILKKEIKIKLHLWQIFLMAFIIASIVSTLVAMLIYKHNLDFTNIIKLNLNCLFLISISMIVEHEYIKFNKYEIVKFMEFIILINFIQIILIYFKGGLFNDFLQGTLSQSSDTAYIISSFNNIIGGDNKNIWASKFLFIYIIYLYTLISFKVKEKIQYVYVLFGGVTILLLLSRTSQLAVAIPIVFYMICKINQLDDKYKKPIFILFSIAISVGALVFFKKFFHIKFDMTDGGFTRLFIWKEFFGNVWDTHWIMGNGIGYSRIFISEVIGRTESNLHNVFFNIFFELGAIGLISYIGFIITFIRDYVNIKNIINVILLVAIPVGFTVLLQYLGFDNDIIMVVILFLIVTKLTKEDEEYAR